MIFKNIEFNDKVIIITGERSNGDIREYKFYSDKWNRDIAIKKSINKINSSFKGDSFEGVSINFFDTDLNMNREIFLTSDNLYPKKKIDNISLHFIDSVDDKFSISSDVEINIYNTLIKKINVA